MFSTKKSKKYHKENLIEILLDFFKFSMLRTILSYSPYGIIELFQLEFIIIFYKFIKIKLIIKLIQES